MSRSGHEAVWQDLTIAVPVYSRPAELRQLLSSIRELTKVDRGAVKVISPGQ